jgi:predicted  nucleic acid-binding Zn-ribbon protein
LNDQVQKLTEAKVKRDVASVVHGTSDAEKQKLLEAVSEKESIICDLVESVKVKDLRIAELEQSLQKMRKKHNDAESGIISNPTGSDSKRDLEKEIVQLTQQNQILMAKANQVAELTRKLEESENGRLVFEKTNFESFEKKLAMIKLNKDAALDSMRKEIASLKASKKEIEIDFMNQITALESTRNGNRSESERKLQAKDEVISRLEQQVFSQEQLLGSMRIELEQLRGSMSKANLSRRDEVDEMQEELLDKAAKLKQKEREISALKMKLDEEKLHHADEIAKLRTQLASRGGESATIKGSREIREGQEIVELKETIQQLRRRNTALSEENSKLCSRIDNLETDKKNIGSSDKWRTSALKDQVKTLMLRVQELEGRHKELRSSATNEWGTGSP